MAPLRTVTDSPKPSETSHSQAEAPFQVSVGRILAELCAPWFTASRGIEFYAALSRVIRQLQANRPEWRNELTALRRGQRELLATLRELVQAGFAPGDVQLVGSNPDKQNLLVRLLHILAHLLFNSF